MPAAIGVEISARVLVGGTQFRVAGRMPALSADEPVDIFLEMGTESTLDSFYAGPFLGSISGNSIQWATSRCLPPDAFS